MGTFRVTVRRTIEEYYVVEADDAEHAYFTTEFMQPHSEEEVSEELVEVEELS